MAAYERAGGYCEITGLPLDPERFEAHHRRPKGMGGTSRPDRDRLSNVLAITPAIHNGGPQSVHQNPGWSRPRGYLLSKEVEWAVLVPVLLGGLYWVHLGDDGRYYPLRSNLGPVTSPEQG